MVALWNTSFSNKVLSREKDIVSGEENALYFLLWQESAGWSLCTPRNHLHKERSPVCKLYKSWHKCVSEFKTCQSGFWVLSQLLSYGLDRLWLSSRWANWVADPGVLTVRGSAWRTQRCQQEMGQRATWSDRGQGTIFSGRHLFKWLWFKTFRGFCWQCHSCHVSPDPYDQRDSSVGINIASHTVVNLCYWLYHTLDLSKA